MNNKWTTHKRMQCVINVKTIYRTLIGLQPWTLVNHK